MGHRAIRALRGTIAAVVSTVVAAASHGIADGQAPGVFALSLALTASVFVCIALAGKSLSRTRLCIAVALSQLAYHGMFIFAPAGGSVESSGIEVHAQHVAGTIDVHASGASHHHAPAMWFAHALAVVITVLLLAHGEQIVRGLFATLALGLSRLVTAPAPVAIPPVRSETPDAVQPRRAPAVVASRSQRGPPALAGVWG